MRVCDHEGCGKGDTKEYSDGMLDYDYCPEHYKIVKEADDLKWDAMMKEREERWAKVEAEARSKTERLIARFPSLKNKVFTQRSHAQEYWIKVGVDVDDMLEAIENEKM